MNGCTSETMFVAKQQKPYTPVHRVNKMNPQPYPFVDQGSRWRKKAVRNPFEFMTLCVCFTMRALDRTYSLYP